LESVFKYSGKLVLKEEGSHIDSMYLYCHVVSGHYLMCKRISRKYDHQTVAIRHGALVWLYINAHLLFSVRLIWNHWHQINMRVPENIIPQIIL